MNNSDYESLLLTLREQFEDEKILDEVDINYLFGIIDTLKEKIDSYDKVDQEDKDIITD